MNGFDLSPNRQARRATGKALPATSLGITRFAGGVLVGIEGVPLYVRLTDVEALQLGESLLKLAGESDPVIMDITLEGPSGE